MGGGVTALILNHWLFDTKLMKRNTIIRFSKLMSQLSVSIPCPYGLYPYYSPFAIIFLFFALWNNTRDIRSRPWTRDGEFSKNSTLIICHAAVIEYSTMITGTSIHHTSVRSAGIPIPQDAPPPHPFPGLIPDQRRGLE